LTRLDRIGYRLDVDRSLSKAFIGALDSGPNSGISIFACGALAVAGKKRTDNLPSIINSLNSLGG
jgi:hypothetical protein